MEQQLKEILKGHNEKIASYETKVEKLVTRMNFCSEHKFEEEFRIANIKYQELNMCVYKWRDMYNELEELVNNKNTQEFMYYSLRKKSNSYLEIKRLCKCFELLPNSFEYYKSFPESANTFDKVVSIKFRWIMWEYELLIRKKINHERKNNKQNKPT